MEEKERPDVDGWTSSGYGIILDGKKVKPITDQPQEETVEEIEEIDALRNSGKNK